VIEASEIKTKWMHGFMIEVSVPSGKEYCIWTIITLLCCRFPYVVLSLLMRASNSPEFCSITKKEASNSPEFCSITKKETRGDEAI
jgi:hypothetical protein